MTNPPAFTQKLLTWYDQQGRHHLPWRQQISPYRTWVSEIMLQQTQVNTVIPYFERFMHEFPSLKHLAKADEEEVLHLWTGLGYYSRARNLYQTAKIIASEYQGKFPDELQELTALPGIGLSTAGAILAIGFNKMAAILDGNVKRVLARYHCVKGWPNSPAVSKQLWGLAQNYTPSSRTADYTQAIMDLGATICTRAAPKCLLCPLQSDCLAHQEHCETEFPHRKPTKSLPSRDKYFLMLRNPAGEILLEKRPPSGIWGSLWSLPELATKADIKQHCEKFYDCRILQCDDWPSFRHTFSHFYLNITPVLVEVEEFANSLRETADRIWYNFNRPPNCGLASPVKKLLNNLKILT